MNKKQKVLLSLFQHCKEKKNFIFDNSTVKKYVQLHSFGNPFDVTKIDHSDKLPKEIVEEDYCVLHLGEGKHMFVKGVQKWYHLFEDIPNENRKQWSYKRSLLNEYDSSESNILSVGINQRIIVDFLYDDIAATPKMYLAKRTKVPSYTYSIGTEKIEIKKLQIEIDMTIELNNQVTVFECKNGFSKDFAVYQIFLPCLYYQLLAEENKIHIQEINACYLVRDILKDSKQNTIGSIVRMYLYTFTDLNKIDSLSLVKSAEYKLSYR